MSDWRAELVEKVAGQLRNAPTGAPNALPGLVRGVMDVLAGEGCLIRPGDVQEVVGVVMERARVAESRLRHALLMLEDHEPATVARMRRDWGLTADREAGQ